MGKFKFTLANVWYWLSFTLITFLVENNFLLSKNPKGGFNITSLLVLSFACIVSLFMFYFVQHKKNGMKVDWVLLPCTIIFGGCFIAAIWLNKTTIYPFANGEGEVVVSFSTFEKIRATLILVVFLAFAYAMFYASRINGLRCKTVLWIAIVGIVASMISLTYSLVKEIDQYQLIFSDGEPGHIVIKSFYWNRNYYGGVLLVGFLCCVIANYYKPRIYFNLIAILFVLGTIATGSMTPSIIGFSGLFIYLLEEIIYFACKKKWLHSISALLCLLIVFAGISLFYYGASFGWKGLSGLNIYISRLFEEKNFRTFTGRTLIWKEVLPYCAKNIQTMLLGHGFLLSHKHIQAITGAMYNTASGVPTTHNGYLEVLFDFGVVGIITNLAMVGFFLYSCIRMAMEKKFHYVFIYVFAALCCAAYNCFESSNMFGIGIKEMFITQLIAIPVLTDAKFAGRKEKTEEILKATARKKMDPLVMGRGAALFIMSFLVVVLMTFLSPTTYENPILKKLMIILAIVFGVALLFVPYLISLYYRKTDSLNFALNCAVNGILFVGICVVLFIFMRSEPTLRPYAIYGTCAIAFFILLVETIMYAIIKGGNFKEWLDVTFKGAFVIPRYAFVGAMVGGFAYVSLGFLGKMNLFIYLTIMFITLIGFYSVFTFLPTKGGKEILEQLNGISIGHVQRLTQKDLTYYG